MLTAHTFTTDLAEVSDVDRSVKEIKSVRVPLAGRAVHSNPQDVLRLLKGRCAAHEKGKRPSQGVKK